jgi:hypothetical protein
MAGPSMGYRVSSAVRLLRQHAHGKICPCIKCIEKRSQGAAIAERKLAIAQLEKINREA